MGFLKSIWSRAAARASGGLAPGAGSAAAIVAPSRQQTGAHAEAAALAYLQRAGLLLVARNFKTPGRGGGEIDLILRDADGTLVFVEVRARSRRDFGGAGASIDKRKQRRIVLAAQHFLHNWQGEVPPCRFDVVLVQPPRTPRAGGQSVQPPLEWLRAAFNA